MKIKTSELTGAALDWTVTKLELDRLIAAGEHVKPWVRDAILAGESISTYSSDWLFGGPIIEREKIAVRPSRLYVNGWVAHASNGTVVYIGGTPLIAAMRCYVASRLGDEVDVLKTLL